MPDQKTRLAYYNSLVLPHLDYANIVWGDQLGLKSEMEQLQDFKISLPKKFRKERLL